MMCERRQYKAFGKFRFLDVKQVHALRRALRVENMREIFCDTPEGTEPK